MEVGVAGVDGGSIINEVRFDLFSFN